MVAKADRAFDAAVNVKRFGAGNFALDYDRASDGGLVNGQSSS
jgi:hypothetical protein